MVNIISDCWIGALIRDKIRVYWSDLIFLLALWHDILPDKLELMSKVYNFQEIEKKWQKKWAEAGLFEVDGTEGDKKQYILVMFPYPSSDGLHVGHVEGYVAADIYARYLRMKGYSVLHPMGWDAFGLPAENYAIKKNVHPRVTTHANIANFRRQLESLGLSYSWDREVDTSSPDYYHWTQWLFLRLYKKGLAYRKKAKVNWCESCQTVLANEQVVTGHCERCQHQVIQKDLKQWFFKVTDYADRLLRGLDDIDWPDAIKAMQRNWIGRSEGAEITFPVIASPDKLAPSGVEGSEAKQSQNDISVAIKVFTTRPDTLLGATYLVLAPEHELIKNEELRINNYDEVKRYVVASSKKTALERAELTKEKTGVELRGVEAVNPANGEKVSVWVADYVLMEYGHGAIMAVPAHDERDFTFAKKFGLPIVEVVSPDGRNHELKKAYINEGKLINSGEFDGQYSKKAGHAITAKVGGRLTTSYRLRDWLVSRQRYWGAPIPIIYCDNCGTVPVPEKDLPVELPDDVDFRPTGESPLARSVSFHKVSCPKCGGQARREADTMDTFVDSSWYFLRFADPKNPKEIFSKSTVKNWLPVDMYIGGAEHAVLHLLYARFVTKFLCDEKLIDFEEPFAKLRNQGLILGPDGQKMSKSRGNVVNPDEIVANYGADTLRLYEMFLGPLEQVKPWDTNGIEGAFRFLKKAYRLFVGVKLPEGENLQPKTQDLINAVSQRIANLRLNTAVSSLMEYVSWCADNMDKISVSDVRALAKVLSPLTPHMAEELWLELGGEGFVAEQEWPKSQDIAKLSRISVPVQVNGKIRAMVTLHNGASRKDAVVAAKEALRSRGMEADKVQKTIYVPGRIISIVTKD